MNSADKHILNEADKIVKHSNSKSKAKASNYGSHQPWRRTLNDNPLLDKFVRSPNSFNFNARVGRVTFTIKNGRYVPALMFDRVVYKGIVRSKHLISVYTKNLAKLNEVWPGDWIKFNASVSKSVVPYYPYLYRLENIQSVRFLSRTSRKIIKCYVPKKLRQKLIKKANEKTRKDIPKYFDYLIYSNRDFVPMDNTLRAGYAISKATTSHVNQKGTQLSFFKRLNNQKEVNYINKYSKWKVQKQKEWNKKHPKK